jgi:hypothetical protein
MRLAEKVDWKGLRTGNETVQSGRIKSFETSNEKSQEECEIPVEEIVCVVGGIG